MPAPKMGISISSSSLLILKEPFHVLQRPWNTPENPDWWDQWKMHWRGTQPTQQGGKSWENTNEIQRKVGLKGRKGAAGSWPEFQMGTQTLLRNSALQPNPPEGNVALQEFLPCLNSL